MRLAHAAGGDGESEVIGEVLIAGVEDRGLTDNTLQHGGLEVIHHGFGWNAAEEGEGVGMTGQELLHGLADRELDVQQAAVAQHHHEEAESAAGIAHVDRAELAPIHLGTFARGERQRQEGRRLRRANMADVVLGDRAPAGVANLTQTQEYLRRGVGVVLKPADDLPLERVQLAGPLGHPPRPELVCRQPASHRAFIQTQLAGDLGHVQVAGAMIVLDLAVQLVVDHWARSIPRRIWPMLSGSPVDGLGAFAAGASNASTWQRGLW